MIAKQQERYDQGMSGVRASENKLSQMKKPTYTIDDGKHRRIGRLWNL